MDVSKKLLDRIVIQKIIKEGLEYFDTLTLLKFTILDLKYNGFISIKYFPVKGEEDTMEYFFSLKNDPITCLEYEQKILELLQNKKYVSKNEFATRLSNFINEKLRVFSIGFNLENIIKKTLIKEKIIERKGIFRKLKNTTKFEEIKQSMPDKIRELKEEEISLIDDLLIKIKETLSNREYVVLPMAYLGSKYPEPALQDLEN